MDPPANMEKPTIDLDKTGSASPQERDWREARQEDRTDRDQTHGHKRFWAEFWTRTCLLVFLAGGGLLVAVLDGDAILRTGGMSVFSGVAGAVIQREASQHRRHGNPNS